MDAEESLTDGSDTGQATRPGYCCGNRQMRALGYVPGGRVRGLDCDQPLRAQCLSCGARETWRCRNHRASRCVPCSMRYRSLVARVASHHPNSRAGYLYLLTVTAPGTSDHQRWRIRNIGERVSCECHRHGLPLGEWNAGAGSRWNRLRTQLRRTYDELEFFRAVEPQRRGALHLHVLVWSPVPVDEFLVQRLALEVGFGCNVDMPVVPPGSRMHAYYVAKYVTKAADARLDVPWIADWTDKSTGETHHGPTMPTYRTWSISHGWGCRMKDVTEAIREAWLRQQQMVLVIGSGGRREYLPGLMPATSGASPP